MRGRKPTYAPHAEAPQAIRLKRAAQIISKAQVLLVLLGDTFTEPVGPNTITGLANSQQIRSRGLSETDLRDPTLKDRDSDVFYGCWCFQHDRFRSMAPHQGFSILKNWLTECVKKPAPEKIAMPGQRAFIVTTAVDGVIAKAKMEPIPVAEVAGNCQKWQCSVPCTKRIWLMPDDCSFPVTGAENVVLKAASMMAGIPQCVSPVSDPLKQFLSMHEKIPLPVSITPDYPITSKRSLILPDSFPGFGPSVIGQNGTQIPPPIKDTSPVPAVSRVYPPYSTHPKCPRCMGDARPACKMNKRDNIALVPAPMAMRRQFQQLKKCIVDANNPATAPPKPLGGKPVLGLRIAILDLGVESHQEARQQADKLFASSYGSVFMIRVGNDINRDTKNDSAGVRSAEQYGIEFNPVDYYLPINAEPSSVCADIEVLGNPDPELLGDSWEPWPDKKKR